MASIISQINWIGNGERADSVTLNRPLLEFLSLYETGQIKLSSSNISMHIADSVFGPGVTDGAVVSVVSGSVVLTDSSNYREILGIADKTYNRVYLSGAIDGTLLDAFNYIDPVTIANDTKFYADLSGGNSGKITNVRTGNEPYIGFTIDYNGSGPDGVKFVMPGFGSGSQDFNITNPQEGDTLRYDSSTGLWVNENRLPQEIVASAAGETFSHNYSIGRVQVFVEGILLPSSQYTATDGTSITIPTVNVGDIVTFI